MIYTVYILFSQEYKKIYIGFTSNLIQRFYSRNIYGKGWTMKFRPWVIIYAEYYESKTMAMTREKQLKQAKGREWIWSKINCQFSIQGFISV